MDVVWIVLDSLSFGATPFAPDGPNSMPRLQALADEAGTNFTNAYVPGPSSPSSHAAMFTGKRPSVAGMHEAYPYFEGRFPTVAETLTDSHDSLLVSANPYLFNGLERGFDVANDLRTRQYQLFESATDPEVFMQDADHDSWLRRYAAFCLEGGKPLRSLLNGLEYKRWRRRQNASIPKSSPEDDLGYQYANTMNAEIRSFLATTDDAFIVANYMDVHPPLDASDSALREVSPGTARADLPVNLTGQEVYGRVQQGDRDLADAMYTLLTAAVRDTDRKVTPLVRELVEDGAFVVVTADHGIWFRRERELDEERLHVPLVVFPPGGSGEVVDYTVNVRQLASTTMDVLNRPEHPFEGPSLLDVTEDQLSVTEFVHASGDSGTPVSPRGAADADVRYDLAAVKGGARIDLIDGALIDVRGDPEPVADLRDAVYTLQDEYEADREAGTIEYDDRVAERLEQFGYL